MAPAVKNVNLQPELAVESQPTTGLSVPASDSPVQLFERLAKDPQASIEKIERLMALWERTEARTAETAFNAAMSEAQAEIRPVAADAHNPQTRSKYASYEALDRQLRPIYTSHGFGLSFDTADSAPESVRVLCYVTHRAGHSKTFRADIPADGKGAKGGDVMTKTHAVGSAMSYGMRYLLKMIFNVAVGEEDDDGRKASGKHEPQAPDGYEDWLGDLLSLSEEHDPKAFAKAWNDSKAEFRNYLASVNPDDLKAMKKRAGLKV